ncbi:MAG: AMP-binding protein [Deltaproteobacteria bacterium]|nr:AMP-binding protein [Deltaproteobacteria bacterium]
MTFPDFGFPNDALEWDSETVDRYRFERIRAQIDFAWNTVPFYRQRWSEAGFEPGDLHAWDDFERLPLITKTDLREYVNELNTVTPGEVREVFTTSGTTGAPVVFRYRAEDLDRLAARSADLLRVAGVEPGDLFQMTMPLGAKMWIAGLNFWLAFQAAGAGTLRFGPGDTAEQIETMAALGATGIFATASFAIRLGEVANQLERMSDLPVRKLLIVNENVLAPDLAYNDMGRRIRELWPGRELRAVYGNTELGFSGAECSAHAGYHTHAADHVFEVLDVDTGAPLPDGEAGRFVVTTLAYRGLPLIRYAIDDITFLMRGSCPCGRTSDRFGPILGRADQMLKIKGGVSLYPPAIENLLLATPEVGDYLFEVFHDEWHRTNVRVVIAPRGDESTATEAVIRAFRDRLQFTPEVRLAQPDEIAARTNVPGKRKAVRFHDLRETR